MNGDSVKIFRIFASIQGESTFSGLPFVFVRLAGCNLDCSWCDSRPARFPDSGIEMSLQSIFERIAGFSLKHVCITGGEPLLQNSVLNLMEQLVEKGYITTLETNGSVDISRVPAGVFRIVDIKCPGSGMAAFNYWANIDCLTDRDQVKFVIADAADYAYARRIVSERLAGFSGAVLFSPVWGVLDDKLLAKWVLSDRIPVRVHLQLHKMLEME